MTNSMHSVSAAVLTLIAGLASGAAMGPDQDCPDGCCKAQAGATATRRVLATEASPLNNVAFGWEPGENVVTQRMNIVQVDDDQRIEIVINNGEVTARVNGQEVPSSRIRREDGRIVIVDKDGKQITEIHTPGSGVWAFGNADVQFGAPHLGDDALGGLMLWSDEDGNSMVLAPDTPKVFIGISMSDADAQLLEHLGVSKGIRIDSIVPDSPAEHDGLQADDIIISIDGHDGLTTESLREVLKSKNPGDEVEIRVIRRGDRKKVELELAPYPQRQAVANQFFNVEVPDHDVDIDIEDIIKHLREHRSEIQGLTDDNIRRLHESLIQGLHPRIFAQLPGENRFVVPRFQFQVHPELRLDRLPEAPSNPRARDQALVEPPAMPGDTGRRLDELATRLDRLERQLDRLVSHLERERDKD
ncbi:MAG: PDZ domain-containing protein [Phycisphaeraceae bacterium]|nr:PDZ domain-containing protein [Phycisphaeraceae bacterium]